jgi:hypothetical protein
MGKAWQIYSLTDPRTGNVRYVGKTEKTLERRVHEHLLEAKRGYRHSYRLHWLQELVALSLRPTVAILEAGTGDWQAAERKWISLLRKTGSDLVNGTDGGDGLSNPGAEIRTKISLASRGRHHSAETRAKISSARLGHLVSVDTRAKISRANKGTMPATWGTTRPPEVMAKMWAAVKGQPKSAEHKAKLSIALKGRIPWNKGTPMSAEQRAKLSVAFLGRPAWNKGRPMAPESRKKLSESRKAYYRCKRAKLIQLPVSMQPVAVTLGGLP